MAPAAVLAATALLSTLAFTSAYDSNYGNLLYSRSLGDDLDAHIYRRAAQKILARRASFESEDAPMLYARDHPCGPGCLCGRHIAREAEAEADADADPIDDALFEHDDILFNYKREAEGGDSFFDNVEYFDLVSRSVNTRDAEAEAEADPIADALFEHDDILFNYKREAEPGSDFFDDVEFSDLITRDEFETRDADADPIADAYFENDDVLFNYRRSLDDPFAEVEFTDLISRSAEDPWAEIEFTDLVSRSASAEADADADADPTGDAYFEHDDILFKYRRSLNDPWDEIEFTDLVSRSPQEDGGFVNWAKSSTAQSRKSDYKSPGQIAAEQKSTSGGAFSGGAGAVGGDGSAGAAGGAGGASGHAFNEALDASQGGAVSMDAAAMDAGGMMG